MAIPNIPASDSLSTAAWSSDCVWGMARPSSSNLVLLYAIWSVLTSSGIAHTSPSMLTASTMGSKNAGKPVPTASVSGISSPLLT